MTYFSHQSLHKIFLSAPPRPDIQPYLSTRWTGQTLLIESPPIPANPAPIPWRFPGHQATALTTQTSNSPLPVNPLPTNLHIGSRKDSPLILNSPPTNTSSTVPRPSIYLVRESQPMSLAHNLVIPLPIISTFQSSCNKIERIWLPWGTEPALQWWELDIITITPPLTLTYRTPASKFFYSSSCTRHIPLPHHALIFNRIHPIGGQGRHT